MKRLLIVLVLVVAAAVARASTWGGSASRRIAPNGESNITFTVDVDKIKEDKGKAMEKVHDLGSQGKDKTSAPAEKATDPLVPPPK
jgi:hypothetical protein